MLSPVPDDVFNRGAFDRLADELGSLDAARRIAALYLTLLDRRVSRLIAACAAGDVSTAMDAVLSLKVSSATVGASAMRDRAADVEERLLSGSCDGARAALEGIRGVSTTTAKALARVVERSTA